MPILKNVRDRIVENNNFLYQDNYKLIEDEKWTIVLIMLTEYSYTISEKAKTINTKLTEFLMRHTPPNEWFILDFPSPQSIQAIYKSNFRDENEYSGGININELIKKTLIINEACEGVCEDVLRVAEPLVEGVDYVVNKVGEGIEYIGDKIEEGLNYIGDKLEDGWNWLFGNDDDNHKGELGRRSFNENSNNTICLQRKIFIDNNNLNKWKIEPNFKDKSFIIISAYDA